LPALYNDDALNKFKNAHAVRCDDDRSLRTPGSQAFYELTLGRFIHCCGGLIKQDDGWVTNEKACQ